MKFTFESKLWYSLKKFYYYFLIVGIILAVAFGAITKLTEKPTYITTMIITVDYEIKTEAELQDAGLSIYNTTLASISNVINSNYGMDKFVANEELKAIDPSFDDIKSFKEGFSSQVSNKNITLSFKSSSIEFNVKALTFYKNEIFPSIFENYSENPDMKLGYRVVQEAEANISEKESETRSLILSLVIAFILGFCLAWIITTFIIGKLLTIKSEDEIKLISEKPLLSTIRNEGDYRSLLTNMCLCQIACKTQVLVGVDEESSQMATKFASNVSQNDETLYIDLTSKGTGFSDVIIGNKEAKDVIKDNVILAGDSDIIYVNYDEAIRNLIAEFEKEYKMVIINAGNVYTPNAKVMTVLGKNVILCLQSTQKIKEEIKAEKVLSEVKANLIGIALEIK